MKPTVRFSLATALLLLAAWPLAEHRERQARRDRLLTLGRPLASQPGTVHVLSSLGSEPNPAAAAARLARSLVAETLVPKAASPEHRDADLARLRLAQGLAIDALGREAASWEGLLALGAATYLEGSLAEDNRLFTETRSWELPLLKALALAPGRTEPARFLSLAYLELWQILPPWKREQALGLLRQGLADPSTFDRLIEPWLAVAESTEEALALVPDQPLAWQRLRTLFETRRDWPAFVLAQSRFDRAMSHDLERRLAETEQALARNDRERARGEVQLLLERMPVDGLFAPLFTRALTSLPPGPVDSSSLPVLSSWFVWALELTEIDRAPFPAGVMGRLSHAVGPTDPAQAALAALASGELADAERLERLAPRLSAPEWAPYWLARARGEAQRGEARRAAAYLAAVSGEAAALPLYWLSKARVAETATDRAAAQAQVDRLAAREWPGAGWSWRGHAARRDLLVAAAGSGLRVEIVGAPQGGAAVDLRWNGTTMATLVAPPPSGSESGWIEIQQAITPGLSRLELYPRAGQIILPGAVRLIGGDSVRPHLAP